MNIEPNNSQQGFVEILVVVLIILILGVGGLWLHNSRKNPGPGSQGSTQPSTALKPQIAGLLDRQALPDAAYQKVVNGHVIQANWADLQPVKGGPIATNNVIDQAISAAQQLNMRDPSLHMQLKLRVYAGIAAPDWLKTMDGTPITVTDTEGKVGHGGTVGHFWTDDYMAAYQDLETKLSAKYDMVPELLEVTVSGCTTVYEEPLLRQASDKASVAGLVAGGYTAALDEQCQHRQVDAMKVWRHTRISMAFNPYQFINTDGSVKTDEAFTETMMAYCRLSLGVQCVLENNSLRATSADDNSAYGQMYAKMKSLGSPIMFQTATEAKIGDLLRTLDFAASQGAKAVELPDGYQKNYTAAQLTPYDQKLEAN